MYQSIILSAFIRAYLLTKNNEYVVFADKVYNSYSLELVDKYGFKVEDKYGLWFEESMISPPTHILNGFVYAIFGLCDYFKLSRDISVQTIIGRCFKTLENTLPSYDMSYWSYYDLTGTIASYSYHNKMHVPILKALYELTEEQIFNEYAIKWERYSQSKYCVLKKKLYSLRTKYF